MTRETEYERSYRQRAERARHYLVLFDAAMAALDVMPPGDAAVQLGQALAKHADDAKYLRQEITGYANMVAAREAAEAATEQAKAAAAPYTGPAMECEVEVAYGDRATTYARCPRAAKWVVDVREKWGAQKPQITLNVCTTHRNVAARKGSLSKWQPRDWMGKVVRNA